jgi:hypothetical protein
MIVSRPRMVGMAMADHSPVNGGVGIDVEAAGPAKKPVSVHRQPGLESVRSHFSIGRVENGTLFDVEYDP